MNISLSDIKVVLAGLPEHQNVFDNPRIWQKNDVFKSEPPLFTLDTRSKIKSNDGHVKQNIDQSSSIRLGTLDIPAHFKSKS